MAHTYKHKHQPNMPMSDRMQCWFNMLDPDNVTKIPSDVAAETRWSASTAPEQAILAFHLFQEDAGAASKVEDALLSTGTVTQGDIDFARRAVARSASANHLALFLLRLGQLEGNEAVINTTGGGGLDASSAECTTPFGIWSPLFEAYRNVRPFEEKSPEDRGYYGPSLRDAPDPSRTLTLRVGRVPPPPDFTSDQHVPSPELPVDSSPTFRGARSRHTSRNDRANVLETPTQGRRSHSSRDPARPPPPLYAGPSTRASQADSTTSTPATKYPSIPGAPPPVTPGTSVGLDPANPSPLRSNAPIYRATEDTVKTEFEVQTSQLAVGLWTTCYIATLGQQVSDLVKCRPQEQGYRFGKRGDGSCIFEARPDAVFYSMTNRGKMTPFAWAEFKPCARRAKDKEKALREEAAQCVALVTDTYNRVRLSQVQAFPTLSKSPNMNSPVSDSSIPQKGFVKLLVTANLNEFFIGILTYNENWLHYITNLDSPVYDDETREEDFASIRYFGPFNLGNTGQMDTFIRVMIGLAVAQLRTSADGIAFLEKFKKELDDLEAGLSKDEETNMGACLNNDFIAKHKQTMKGRIHLRRTYKNLVKDLS